MESAYYLLSGVILYFISDWLLQQMELAAGRRFEYRSLIFFAILLTLALTSFAFIRVLMGGN